MERMLTPIKTAWRLLLAAALCLPLVGMGQVTTLARWDFNDDDTNADTGIGTLTAIGGVTSTFTSGSGSSDPAMAPDQAWTLANFPSLAAASGTAGLELAVNTTLYTDIQVKWDQRNSQTGSRYVQVLYSTDGTSFTSTGLNDSHFPGYPGVYDLYPTSGGASPAFNNGITFNLKDLPGVHNNPNFNVRIV